MPPVKGGTKHREGVYAMGVRLQIDSFEHASVMSVGVEVWRFSIFGKIQVSTKCALYMYLGFIQDKVPEESFWGGRGGGGCGGMLLFVDEHVGVLLL